MSLENYNSIIKNRLDKEDKYRDLLFKRGYLLTDAPIKDLSAYPFYNLWEQSEIGNYYLYIQKSQTSYSFAKDGLTSVIIGHAYNPFDMQCDENALCEDLINAYQDGLQKYFDKVSEFTGLHIVIMIDGEKIICNQDACSLTGCYFGRVDGKVYISEHPQLVADICDLKMNRRVERLIKSKCYNIGNRNLPGNITPYDELKRLGANTYLLYDVDFSINRF